ncbi:hypothetical protein ATK74_1427 [Propionicimonas paludicola]|uniref:YgjP-like metallopeptidase domain-containing protein n=1 Tax=Propionicimonas paludicola TaxID=185243 RepID=A0A2A9CTC9_9ACTN|nr:hypothetical protein ATK74_1427 [Propionicimonas paludicola]
MRRSRRRTRTLTVFREGGRLVAVVPERISAREQNELIPPLVQRFLRREAKRGLPQAPDELNRRALELYRRYLRPLTGEDPPGFSVTWSSRQQHRWGSCSAWSGEIRLSARLQTMPSWVSDYVLLHELAHLHQPNHSAEFHRLLSGYPDRDRAKAYLLGYQHGAGMGESETPDAEDDYS